MKAHDGLISARVETTGEHSPRHGVTHEKAEEMYSAQSTHSGTRSERQPARSTAPLPRGESRHLALRWREIRSLSRCREIHATFIRRASRSWTVSTWVDRVGEWTMWRDSLLASAKRTKHIDLHRPRPPFTVCTSPSLVLLAAASLAERPLVHGDPVPDFRETDASRC